MKRGLIGMSAIFCSSAAPTVLWGRLRRPINLGWKPEVQKAFGMPVRLLQSRTAVRDGLSVARQLSGSAGYSRPVGEAWGTYFARWSAAPPLRPRSTDRGYANATLTEPGVVAIRNCFP